VKIRCDAARIERLKEAALVRRREYCTPLDSTLYLDAYLANLDQPPILREALALERKCAGQEILIFPDEVIVGREGREVFDFNFLGGLYLRGDWQEVAARGPAGLSERLQQAEALVTRRRTREALAPAERDSMEAGLAATIFVAGHMVLDWGWLLRVGVDGLAQAVEARQRFRPGLDPAFYAAMQATVRAISTFISRHAEAARAQVAAEPDPARRAELEGIAACCAWVAHRPPRTFYEALQLMWLVYVLAGCDSLGRFDQYLWRFYERDLREGRLTREEAGYLLQCTWCKVLEGFGIQNLTLGGTDEEGEDAANDLTLLCLETTRALRTPQPNLALRLFARSTPALRAAAMETIALGLGVPALYNDEVIIPGLQDLGIPLAEARDYCLAGCSQVVIPGRSHFLCDDGVLNAAKCLELALNNGQDLRTGKQLGPRTGAPDELADMRRLLAAFDRQVEHAAEVLGACLDANERTLAESCGYPLRSLLIHDCLESGQGLWQGGARYNAAQAECIGITTAADSLSAIQQLVYEDHTCSLAELTEILRRNWEGREALALYCRNKLPKFGNDDDRVDELYARVADVVYRAVRAQPCRRGGMIIPGSVIFSYHVDWGRRTGATPDGRRAGQPLADSAGPAQGANRRGPTAIINSMAKFDQSLAPTCVVLNLMFSRSAFQPGQLSSLIETYFAHGGMQAQINVVDKDLLRQAQERPEEFRHLTVRVGGYSAYFGELPRELQDEILTRNA